VASLDLWSDMTISELAINDAIELPVRASDGLPYLELTDEERAELRDLGEELLDSGRALDAQLDELALRAFALPDRLRNAVIHHRVSGRPYGGLIVSNLPIDETAAGPTPTRHGQVIESREADRASAVLLLVGSLLGAPISYLSQQHGKMVLDLFPIAGHEHEQLGSSSTTSLEWHNEDAFHPLRADWIMLLSLRNHDAVPTTFASVQDLELSDELREELMREQFVILPDESHTASFNSSTTGVGEDPRQEQAFRKIAEMIEQPGRIAVLSGDAESPFIRIDPAFMPGDRQGDALRPLEAVIREIDAKLRDVVLAPGEMLILDNKRAVHGRKPFVARYDGQDRWLRRINVIADLRQAEGRRFGTHSRALV
jgi:Fe(II)/alpha-ketoglutarate-dependent arginine beta-hydroxylase